jgi:hypothetical protein
LLHTSGGGEREREREARDGKECIWSLFVTFFAFFLSFFSSLWLLFLKVFFRTKIPVKYSVGVFFLLSFLLQGNTGSTKA